MNPSKENERLIVRGPDAIAAALGLSLSYDAGQQFEDAVWRFQRAIGYFDLSVFKSGNDPLCVYQEDLDKISAEAARYVIRGMKAIAEALGFTADETCLKRVQRAIKNYSLPVFKDKNKICICRIDIENLLIGRKSISNFLGISEKTLSRWIKKYSMNQTNDKHDSPEISLNIKHDIPAIPIKNKHGIPCADKFKLSLWHDVWIQSKKKISNRKTCNCCGQIPQIC